MSKQVIYIGQDGTMRGLHESLARELGLVRLRRYSRIEPANRFLRALFYSVRKRVSDDSFLAKTTRAWPVLWQVRICDTGQHLGYFWRRRKANDAEKDFFESYSDNLRSGYARLGGDQTAGGQGT